MSKAFDLLQWVHLGETTPTKLIITHSKSASLISINTKSLYTININK